MTIRQLMELSEAKRRINPGDVNRNGQVVIRDTGLPGTDHLQRIYQLGCSHCGCVYGANGSDVGGKPGLRYE